MVFAIRATDYLKTCLYQPLKYSRRSFSHDRVPNLLDYLQVQQQRVNGKLSKKCSNIKAIPQNLLKSYNPDIGSGKIYFFDTSTNNCACFQQVVIDLEQNMGPDVLRDAKNHDLKNHIMVNTASINMTPDSAIINFSEDPHTPILFKPYLCCERLKRDSEAIDKRIRQVKKLFPHT